jgi:5-methylcytosine-specific restriction endonuclease McrA
MAGRRWKYASKVEATQARIERQRRYDEARYPREAERRKARTAAWRAANPEKKRAQRKAEYERNKEAAKAAAREWTRTHPEHAAATHRAYRAANHEAVLHAERVKNARRKGAPGHFTAEDIRRIYNEQEGCCYYCGKSLTRYHIEHKTPIVRGGSNDPENIAVACARCNLRKGYMTEQEFREVRAQSSA